MKAFYESGLYCYYYPLLSRYARRRGLAMRVANDVALQVVWDQYCAHGTATLKDQRLLLKHAVVNHATFKQQISIFHRLMSTLPIPPAGTTSLLKPLKASFL